MTCDFGEFARWPRVWVDEKTAQMCIRKYLSKIDEVKLMKGEATGLRVRLVLFRWCCAVCHLVLEKKLTMLGGAIKLVHE